MELRRVDEAVWEVARKGAMRVPGRVFADGELLEAIEEDGSLEQLANVATLPGIVDAALAMPDAHQGYGFPVGGVAATEPPEGVVSPGGVGYDINCGVRLLALPLSVEELGGRKEAVVHAISREVPAGMGRQSGPLTPSPPRGRRRAGSPCGPETAPACSPTGLVRSPFSPRAKDWCPSACPPSSLGTAGLEAVVEGSRGSPPHLVKAATYHRLDLSRAGDGYRATVVLDI